MYLHEGLEPKVVHRDIKWSNILLDKKWSHFGMALCNVLYWILQLGSRPRPETA